MGALALMVRRALGRHPLSGLIVDLRLCVHDLLHSQALRQPVYQHDPGVAGQLLLPKADIEFPDLADYTTAVHLFVPPLRQDGALLSTLFASKGGLFLSL